MTKNVFHWQLRHHFRKLGNQLCPSPFVVDDQLLFFYGQQDEGVRAAKLKCIKISSDFSDFELDICFENDLEHKNSLGNLPNSVFFSGADTVNLICAEFTESKFHKHRLLAHLHEIALDERRCLIRNRFDLDFIDYESDEFHTVAGMSFFEFNYYYAKGSAWHEYQNTNTPVTHIYDFDTRTKLEYEVSIPFEKDVLAFARPNLTRLGQEIFLALSVRLRSGDYGSRLYLDSGEGYTRIRQTFLSDTGYFDEDELAYVYPFFWMDKFWCIATLDFRGANGFQLFELV